MPLKPKKKKDGIAYVILYTIKQRNQIFNFLNHFIYVFS